MKLGIVVSAVAGGHAQTKRKERKKERKGRKGIMAGALVDVCSQVLKQLLDVGALRQTSKAQNLVTVLVQLSLSGGV